MDKRTSWSECIAKLGGSRATIYFDGGAWPTNPGHGAIGLAVVSPDKRIVRLEWRYLGDSVSNNEAEHAALLRGIELAKNLRLTRVDLRGDSKLAVDQVNGHLEIESTLFDESIRAFHEVAKGFRGVTVGWIPREENEIANALVGMARQEDWGRAKEVVKDGRDSLTRFLMELLLRHGVVARLDGPQGYIVANQVIIRPIPYYLRRQGATLPSIEQEIWDSMNRMNRKTPVVVAWRPQGLRQGPLPWKSLGEMPRSDFALAGDMEVEPLFAFVRDLHANTPMTGTSGPVRGFRGSRVLELEGPWRTTREFFWWQRHVNV